MTFREEGVPKSRCSVSEGSEAEISEEIQGALSLQQPNYFPK
jgi:hypothetical protein